MKTAFLASCLNRIFSVVSAFTLIGWPMCSSATTLVVTNNANSGAGTLRTLLPTARNGDVITFAVTGFITNVVIGGLTISNSISIVGPGPDVLTMTTGSNWFSAFQVINGATSSISGLTFCHCGVGIYNFGNLTVSNCVFTNNYASNGGISGLNGGSGMPGSGGSAIYNSGVLTAANCQFLNNGAGHGGFGTPFLPYFWGLNSYTTGGNGASGGSGGAVYDIGTASFLNCTFGWNSAGAGGIGGTGNSGSGTYVGGHGLNPGSGYNGGNGGDGGHGGAVFTGGGAKFVSCTFFGNTAGTGGNGGPGGDAYNPTGHSAYPGGNGGNAGKAGSGALYSTGACQIIACTFYNNTAGVGGSGGSGGSGSSDGITGYHGGSGANAGNGGSGGAIYGPRTSGTNFILQNVLVAGNNCGYAGSPGYAGADGGGHLIGTSGTNGLSAADGTGPDLSGFFTSSGHNLVSLGDGATGFTNNVRNDIVGTGVPIDAMLADLADNHGSVLTCALLIGSPAMDAGDDTLLASNIVKDARGYARKSGTHVDIGAYEHSWLSAQIKCRATVTTDGALVSLTNTPGALFTVLGTTDFTLPMSSWDVLGPMTEIAPGQFQWTDVDSLNYDLRFFSVRSP